MRLSLTDVKKMFPEEVKKIKKFFIILYSVGVTGTAIPFTRQVFIFLTPFILILSIFIIAVFHSDGKYKKDWLVFTSIFITSFIIEMFGVNTSFPFGEYSYGKGLGIKIWNTPVLIGLNWVLLVYCTGAVLEKINVHNILKINIASALMVIYDIIMEQVAPYMDMWSFDENIIPLKNYLSWFVIALFFHSVIKISGVRLSNNFAPLVFYCQTGFFILLFIYFKIV